VEENEAGDRSDRVLLVQYAWPKQAAP
jgi:hypothetical protein